jgi:uncharacterized protein DUF6582
MFRMAKLNQEKRDHIPDDKFAFPAEEKEPLNDAVHVRNAIARFNQVKGVTDSERDAAWKRIRSAANKFDVEIEQTDWRDLPHHGKNTTAHEGGRAAKTHKAKG